MLINTLFQLDICVLSLKRKKGKKRRKSLPRSKPAASAPQQDINHLGLPKLKAESWAGKAAEPPPLLDMTTLNPSELILTIELVLPQWCCRIGASLCKNSEINQQA